MLAALPIVTMAALRHARQAVPLVKTAPFR